MPAAEPQRALGQAIRELRKERELSQLGLAVEANVDPGRVSRIEAGKVNPTWGTVQRLARALGVRVSELAKRVERIERRSSARR